MDDRQFDNLTRRLASSASRRTIFRGLVGGLTGGLLGMGRRETAAAQLDLDLDLDLGLDLLVCVGLSPLLATRLCISLGLPHVADAACEGGRCVITACEPGWADCDGDAATGCETPLGTAENCAACDDACASGECRNGSCGLPNGSPCTDGASCGSGFCVDSVCCDVACAGQCEACNLPGLNGVCSAVTGVPVGGRPTCPGDGPCRGACDGQTRTSCADFPDAETPCGGATCAGGVLTTLACDGNGSCAPTTTSCAPFDCDAEGTACLTTCADASDPCGGACCGAEQFCRDDACVALLEDQQGCTADNLCRSGYCDYYHPGSEPLCLPSDLARCFPPAPTCPSGTIGGVCCPTDVEGAPGRCLHLDTPAHCGTSCDDVTTCGANQDCVDGQCVDR